MLSTHIDAERRYDELRKVALRVVSSQIPPNIGLDFRLINKTALLESQKWNLSQKRLVKWDWLNSYGAFKFRFPKRFELALWQKKELTSLSLGRPTYNGKSLRLDFIEGNPDNSKVKVFPLVIAAMTIYAEALGANELRVMNPINEDVKNYYQNFGLIYVPKGDYLFTNL